MSESPDLIHSSVLLKEVLDFLKPKGGGIYVDGNLGMGGHSEAILKSSAPDGVVVGFDWDVEAMQLARHRLSVFGDRVKFVQENFAAAKKCLSELGIEKVDGFLLDLGLSSYQLDKSDRGFSFKGCQSLDMRMDARRTLTAAHLLKTASEEELADIFYYYGEERQARRIASFVVQKRKKQLIETTADLVAVVEQAVPKRFRPKKIHVATKVFQALRIVVNQELENLESVLRDGSALLDSGGVFGIISFHSLEDRLVKKAFREDNSMRLLTKKPVVASDEECSLNPRARSAKFRVAMKR